MLNAEMIKDAEQRRLAWRCRRGMLELDIVLQRFIANQFNDLNLEELHVFDEMLELPDNDFWSMINLNDATEDSSTHYIVISKLRAARYE